jgi:hypothetical protein
MASALKMEYPVMAMMSSKEAAITTVEGMPAAKGRCRRRDGFKLVHSYYGG